MCPENSPPRPGILVVDDDPRICVIIAATLEEQGYRVWTAIDPADAMRLAERHGSDMHLLISDVQMPYISGPALAAEVLFHKPSMRIHFISGSPQLFPELGSSVLPKPFSMDDLIRRVEKLAPRFWQARSAGDAT